jgi:DNA mismatch endonuclease, patch repair protein
MSPRAEVRRRMQQTLQRDNALECAVRSGLHRRGLRFRKHFRVVAGVRAEADIAFPGRRLAVMIDGCFWHGCPEHRTRPQRNEEWWARKLDANEARDRRTDATFRAVGWQVLRFWEHERVEEIVARIEQEVRVIEVRASSRSRAPNQLRSHGDGV